MDGTTPAGSRRTDLRDTRRHTPTGTKGDVDKNGDVVDELISRLRGAVGPCVGIDPDEHVAAVAGELGRVRISRGLA